MKTYIILFRGINVGGKNILPMKELVILLQGKGYKDVKTYIQSGNVILKSNKKPGSDIASAIKSKFGFKQEFIVLEKPEFDACVRNNPYKSSEGKTVHFYFCNEPPQVNLEKLKKLAAETEEHKIKGKVFYLHAPAGIGRSKLVANIDACLGTVTTGRNLNTVTKLQQMAAVAGEHQ